MQLDKYNICFNFAIFTPLNRLLHMKIISFWPPFARLNKHESLASKVINNATWSYQSRTDDAKIWQSVDEINSLKS